MFDSMIISAFSLLGVQFLALVLGAIIYSRQKSAADNEKRERGVFGPRVDEALRQAHDALLGVERIDVEQYKALAKKLAEAYQEIEMLKAKVLAQEESIKSLSNKVASRDRADRRAMERETDDTPPTRPQGGADGIMEELKAQGIAVPLFPDQQSQAPQNHSRPAFGRQLGRGG